MVVTAPLQRQDLDAHFPGGNPDDFSTWSQIEDLARYPYDLYFMDANGENVRLVVSGLENSWTPKWSPTNENLLAISGSVKGQQRLWLYNRETMELQLLWSSPSLSCDWSPDGSKIVVLEFVDPNKDGFRQSSEAKIIEVPRP